MSDDDDHDESFHSPADPPFIDDRASEGRSTPGWWQQLDVVRVAAVLLGAVAVVLLLVILVQRLVG